MSPIDDSDEERGFKVQDRRRFEDSGDTRQDAADRTSATGSTAPPSPPPPASAPSPADAEYGIGFTTFVLSLSTQALAHLGEIPNPIDQSVAKDLPAARQLIDIIGMLRDKTAGNLDAAEAGLLDHILYDLRMRYVEAQ